MSFPTHKSYKDSGAAWLGQVPAHWTVSPLKYVAEFKSGGTPDKAKREFWDGDVPWASAKDLKTADLFDTVDHITTTALEVGAATLVEPGTLLVVVRGMILARLFPVAKACVPMAINQDLKAVVAKPGVNPDFLAWLLRGSEPETLSRLDEAGHGTKALRMDAWTAMRMPMPPLDEQGTVSSFLDREVAQIDALVEAQQCLIELLKEKRQAVISQAVTKGLDPSVSMKDSGVEWLGKVPVHWDVRRLNALADLIQTGPFGSQLHSEEYVDDETPVINPSNIGPRGLEPNWKCTVDQATLTRLGQHQLHVGEIVLARRGEMGRCAVVEAGSRGWLCGTGSMKIRLNSRMLPAYAATFLGTARSREQLQLESVGSTMDNLNAQIVGRVAVPCPPVSEQQRIMCAVDELVDQVDGLVDEADEAMNLLVERRSALISAAVTGKIDVRGLVPQPEAVAA